MDEHTINLLVDVTKFILPGVVLPLVIIGLNNAQNRKVKRIEQEFDLKKLSEQKVVDRDFGMSSERRNHEKDVYAYLVRILFEVQKLHIELSGNCVNYDCLNDAISKFKEKFTIYQDKIADNQLYLNAEATNELYGFYSTLGDLLIELKELQDQKKYHLALPSVYFRAEALSMSILQLRLIFIPEPINLNISKKTLDKKYRNFVGCCGEAPKQELIEEYKKFNFIGEGMDKKYVEINSTS